MTNIMAVVKPEHLFKWGPGFGIPTDFWVAHKEAFPEGTEPEHLCWLYHELYDHTGLTWEDLLRVGKIWVTIKVNFDYNF